MHVKLHLLIENANLYIVLQSDRKKTAPHNRYMYGLP